MLLQAYRLQHSATLLLYALGNHNISVAGFTVVLTLVQWAGAEPAVSPSSACILSSAPFHFWEETRGPLSGLRGHASGLYFALASL